MVRKSRNLGKTEPCPTCKHTLARDISENNNIITLYIKCPHCARKNIDTFVEIQVEVIKKTQIKSRLVPSAILLAILILGFSLYFGISQNQEIVQSIYQQ